MSWWDRGGKEWEITAEDLEPGDSIYRYDLTAAFENGYTEEELVELYEDFKDAMELWDLEGREGEPPQEMYDWFVDVLDYFDPEEWEERYG